MIVGLHLFANYLTEDPVYFVQVVVAVVASITLHELGHALTAIRLGDETPRLAGRLTLNPLAHMGWFSLVVLMLVGIAWGSTPVDPRRLRGRYGDAIVSVAGPLVNVLLALVGLTAFAIWSRGGGADTTLLKNVHTFLMVFGYLNVVLFLLNLVPIPPLDGSRVLADLVPAYRRLVSDPNNQGAITVAFIAIFLGAGYLFQAAARITAEYLSLWGVLP